jgi:hypothetical protein
MSTTSQDDQFSQAIAADIAEDPSLDAAIDANIRRIPDEDDEEGARDDADLYLRWSFLYVSSLARVSITLILTAL